jgi:putative peptidoglycan lipid II flippase
LQRVIQDDVACSIGAILNIRGRFAAPMRTPVINNLIVIVVGGLYVRDASEKCTDLGFRVGTRNSVATSATVSKGSLSALLRGFWTLGAAAIPVRDIRWG